MRTGVIIRFHRSSSSTSGCRTVLVSKAVSKSWHGSREREDVSWIPVIVFTASEDPEHARRAYALGVRHFMRKVDDYGELTEAVKEELHRWIETQQREANG